MKIVLAVQLLILLMQPELPAKMKVQIMSVNTLVGLLAVTAAV